MAISTPVSFWNLNESSGDATDELGVNTLTNTGTATYSPGLLGSAVSITANSQYLSKASALGITNAGDFSISLWVKLGVENTADHDIFNLNVNGASGMIHRGVYEYNGGTRRLRFYHGGTANTFLDVNGNLGTANWHHLVYTRKGSNGAMNFYKNNASPVTGTGTGNTNPAHADEFMIGSTFQYSYTAPFNGLIDMVGVWNVVLTAAEVSELYNSGNGLAYPFTSQTYASPSGGVAYSGGVTMY